jgi:hypothetical protein
MMQHQPADDDVELRVGERQRFHDAHLKLRGESTPRRMAPGPGDHLRRRVNAKHLPARLGPGLGGQG